MVVIEDTIHCEDLHHHLPSNTIFTACEDSATTRFAWFPALGILDDPIKGVNSQGSIHVIEPKVCRAVYHLIDGRVLRIPKDIQVDTAQV